MPRHRSKPICIYCGDKKTVPNRNLCLKHRIQDLKRLSKFIEEGKQKIREALSPEKRVIWDALSSQRRKLAVFQCWENGILYWTIPGTHRVVESIVKHFNK